MSADGRRTIHYLLEPELELLGVLPLLLGVFPEELPLELLVDELEELPLWLELPLEVPPCPELLPEVWLVKLLLELLVSDRELEAEPEPEREPLPPTLEPWLLDELGRLKLVLELEELSGVVMRGLLAEELPEAELSLELEPELPVLPRSA